MRSFFTLILLALVALGTYKLIQYKMNDTGPATNANNPIVTIITSMGDIELELFKDKTPNTVENFISLAEKGFYNDTLFHRVIPDFMIQAGDPNTRNGDPSTYGTGGPGYRFNDEFVRELSNTLGTLSMANAGPNTNGSQFFINVKDNPFLDGKHTVFGKVIGGMNVAIAISNVARNQRDLPNEPVRIDRIVIKNI